MPRKSRECLLLRTADHRQFLTDTGNYDQLIEFSKTFGASMSIIRTETPNLPILDLARLAPAICDPAYTPVNLGRYEVISPKAEAEAVPVKPMKLTPAKNPHAIANQIRDCIRRTFLLGEVVDCRVIAHKFRNYRLQPKTFSNHIQKVREMLVEDGYTVERVGIGQYQATKG